MWQIKNPEIKPKTLDFSSSDQGRFQASQLLADGVEIINALELVEWGQERTQFLICEECGYTHCKPGDWISLRKSGSLVVILPAFEAAYGEGEENTEYKPPYYLRQKGIAYFERATYEHLRSMHSAFPSFEEIRPLSVREAALIYHWNVPARVLGEPPHIDVRSDIVLASSEGEHAPYLKQLVELVQAHYENESVVALRAMRDQERVITFFLDAEEFIEWDALVFDGSALRLLIDSKYVVDATALGRTTGQGS